MQKKVGSNTLALLKEVRLVSKHANGAMKKKANSVTARIYALAEGAKKTKKSLVVDTATLNFSSVKVDVHMDAVDALNAVLVIKFTEGTRKFLVPSIHINKLFTNFIAIH